MVDICLSAIIPIKTLNLNLKLKYRSLHESHNPSPKNCSITIIDLEEEIDDKLKIQTVSTGNPFIILPVKTLKTIQRLTPDNKAMGFLSRLSVF